MLFQPGETLFHKYRIEKLLGQGAFGEVYLATHLALNVPRALKVLRKDAPGLGSQEFERYRSRFQAEAALGARLNSPNPHPNLLQVFDFEDEDDTLALSMQYAPGGSLAQQVEQALDTGQPIPLEKAVQWTMEAARGLAELHRRDLVHRDVKPSNILLDGEGHARLADLGLVQTPQSRLLEGSIGLPHPGTREYMPPEQVPPHTDPLRASADVYALGCTLFELLTGRVLFFQRQGTRLRTLRPDVPQWLDDLVERMVAEDAKKRPWEGTEVANLLSGNLARQETGANRKSTKDGQKRLTVEFKPKRIEKTKQADQKAARLTVEQERQQRETKAKERQQADEKYELASENKSRLESETTNKQDVVEKIWLKPTQFEKTRQAEDRESPMMKYKRSRSYDPQPLVRWGALGLLGLICLVWTWQGPKLISPSEAYPLAGVLFLIWVIFFWVAKTF